MSVQINSYEFTHRESTDQTYTEEKEEYYTLGAPKAVANTKLVSRIRRAIQVITEDEDCEATKEFFDTKTLAKLIT